MQESSCAFRILVQKVCQNVFILLRPFNRKEKFLNAARLILSIPVISFKRLEIAINTHQACAPADVGMIIKSPDQVQQTLL